MHSLALIIQTDQGLNVEFYIKLHLIYVFVINFISSVCV